VTLVDQGQLYHRHDRADARLGRNLWLDARSLAYRVEGDPDLMALRLRSVRWDRVLPVLDQGDLGACTGYAGTGMLGTAPYWWQVGQYVVPQDAGHASRFAVKLYSDATKVDPWPGQYPPDDTGSSGLAVCKVLKTRGTITGYRWATSARGLVRLLQDGPVMMGMPWHSAFFEPDRSGFIDNGQWWTSGVAGGHEVEVVAVDVNERDLSASVLTCVNSWGSSWGDAGRFRMRVGTYERLRGVDLKQFVVD